MISVYKTTLEIADEQKVEIQKGSSIIKVSEQHGKITLWFICDPEAELVEETFYVVGTGQQLPDTFPGVYVNSCMCEEFVWHVFFKRKPNVQQGKPVIAPTDPGAQTGER